MGGIGEGIAALIAAASETVVSGAAGAGAAGAGAGAAAGVGTAAAGAAAGGLSSTVIGGIASGLAGAGLSAALAPKPPKAQSPAALPDPDAVEAARRRSLAQQMGRSGRASTILTQDTGDTLG